MRLKMERKAVTPIPAPIRMVISDLKTFQKEQRKAVDVHDGAISGVRHVGFFVK